MTAMRHRYSPLTRAERDASPITDLNRQTNAAYAACAGRGGHRRSGHTIVRDVLGDPVALPICADCGVPYRRTKRNWAGAFITVTEAERPSDQTQGGTE